MQQRVFLIAGAVALGIGAAAGYWAAHSRPLPVPISPSPSASFRVEATPVQTPLLPESKEYADLMRDAQREEQSGRWMLAIREYDKAIALESDRTEARLARGRVHLKLLRPVEAKEDFTAILSRDPTNEEVEVAFAQAVLLEGNFDDAFARTQGKSSHGMAYYHAVLQCSGGQFLPCKSELTKLTSAPEPWGKRAKRVGQAFEEFDLFSDGDEAHRKTLIAKALSDNEDFALAERMMNALVTQTQEYRDAWILLGYARYVLQRYEEALDALQRAQALDQKKPETAYYTGLVQLKLGRSNEAVRSFTRALDFNYVSRLDVQKYLADTFVDMGDYDSALKHYLDIVNEGVTRDITAYVRPMWVYVEIKEQPEKALELARKAYQRYPGTAMGYNLVGWGNLAYGNLEEADRNLQEALVRDPDLQAAHLNLGDLHLQRAETDRAREAYKKAYELDPNSSIGSSAANKYNALR